MSPRREGQGQPIDQSRWPAEGMVRDWLSYCDRIHRANNLPSLNVLAAAMNLKSRSDVGGMLRGLRLPADLPQARGLLVALGAVGSEVDRGLRKYRVARAEFDSRNRDKQPGWWSRSGYLAQVADIAPLQLLDRDSELAELAAWCTGNADERYVWWQAGPWAGKSALMSWFVLHPPPTVWVVSFFVTARYTGQADSSAFADELIDQLAAITGQQVPPVTSARERDRLRRQLLDEAAAKAATTGCQLVLLVDGLDEDCGAHPRSGLPSIARCLPKHPGEMKVIVAGRPDPPLPADIIADPDHPLHHSRIRLLAESPYARQVMQLAQDELDQVLATDPDRDNGLGYQVLGLVTASGGGLEHRDLHELTGRPVFEIDRLLRGVFGRTIAGRADPDAAQRQRVFLFTHETLRVQAIDRLGPHTLARFRQRLHTWASGYRLRHWPPDTPTYLLRGYPRMLGTIKDLNRLVALATDPDRHGRMLDASGGDAVALAEIAAVTTLNSAQARPDLAVALRLAWHRDHLADRNTNIPVRLPAVWAALSQLIRAEALARSTTDPDREVSAIAGLVRAVADAGDLGRARRLATDAEQTARAIFDPNQRASALTELVRAVADAGDQGRARRLATDAEHAARSIADPYNQAAALARVVEALANTGEHDRAERIARAITDPDTQASALVRVVEALANIGEYDRAEQVARTITDPGRQASALAHVLTGLAGSVGDAGDIDRACELATDAEQIARAIVDAHLRMLALADLATALTDVGEHRRAERVARAIIDPHPKAWALTDLVRAVADAGDHDRAQQLASDAEQTARAISDPHLRASALAGLVRAVAAVCDHDRAQQLATDAEHAARSIADPYNQAAALARVVEALANAGEHDRAERIVRTITDTGWPEPGWDLARSQAVLVSAVANAGEHGRAERIVRTITDPGWQAWALAEVARAVAVVGKDVRARELTTDAEQIARTIAYSGQQGWALARVVRAVADMGDHIRAEQIARTITYPGHQASALAWAAKAIVDAEPATALSLTVTALATSRWTASLDVINRLSAKILAEFVDECILGESDSP